MPPDDAADLPETQEQAANGLDAILDKAMEGFGASEKSAEAAPDKPDDTEVKADAAGRLHGKDGKFAPKDTATDAKPSDGASEVPDKAVSPQPAPEPAPAQQFEPHPRWNETQKAAFAALTPEAKKFSLEVQAEHEANFTRKSQEYAEFKRTAEPIVQAIQPFQQYLQDASAQTGVPVARLLYDTIAYAQRLGDPGQKDVAFAQLAQRYGVDVAALSRGEVAQPDPASQQLRQQVQQLTQRLASFEQQTEQEQQRQLSTHIDTFANAKAADGSPKYPHFGRVRGIMGQLMANGEALTMEEAYTKATEPIAQSVAEELARRQKAAEETSAAALEKARKAAPVKSSGSSPNGATKAKGLDAIINENLSRAGFN